MKRWFIAPAKSATKIFFSGFFVVLLGTAPSGGASLLSITRPEIYDVVRTNALLWTILSLLSFVGWLTIIGSNLISGFRYSRHKLTRKVAVAWLLGIFSLPIIAVVQFIILVSLRPAAGIGIFAFGGIISFIPLILLPFYIGMLFGKRKSGIENPAD